MANFVKHEPCPGCGSRDNLGRYDDGSAWCFGGCKYYEPPSHGHRISNLKENIGEETPRKKWFDLPDDVDSVFGKAACDWLGIYPITYATLRNNHVVWSECRQQLIYKFMVNGRLEGWQARNFLPNPKSKVFTSGEVNTLLPIYGNTEDRRELVIVEDPLSAINVGQIQPCMPLLGSHLAGNKLHAICMLYDSVVMWLDNDKYRESMDIAMRFEMTGTPSLSVNSTKDPKYYTTTELHRILNGEAL